MFIRLACSSLLSTNRSGHPAHACPQAMPRGAWLRWFQIWSSWPWRLTNTEGKWLSEWPQTERQQVNIPSPVRLIPAQLKINNLQSAECRVWTMVGSMVNWHRIPYFIAWGSLVGWHFRVAGFCSGCFPWLGSLTKVMVLNLRRVVVWSKHMERQRGMERCSESGRLKTKWERLHTLS